MQLPCDDPGPLRGRPHPVLPLLPGPVHLRCELRDHAKRWYLVRNRASTVYSFWIKDVDDGGTAKKFTVFQADLVSCYWTVCDSADGYDQQMTYYDDTDEYHFEFDLSDCGTGSEGCFYDTDDDYFDGGNWRVRSATAPTAACYQCYGTINSDQNLHIDGGGVLDIDETDGPGMNLIFLWNSTANEFGVVGVGDEDTGITNKLTGGDTAVRRGGTSYTGYYAFPIPGDITGTFCEDRLQCDVQQCSSELVLRLDERILVLLPDDLLQRGKRPVADRTTTHGPAPTSGTGSVLRPATTPGPPRRRRPTRSATSSRRRTPSRPP